MNEFQYQPIFEAIPDSTEYISLGREGVAVEQHGPRQVLIVDPAALRRLTEAAFDDVSHLLRASHLAKLAAILHDPEASPNDRFVATELLRNSVIAAEREFPTCQDTGTAIIQGKKGEDVFTGVDDAYHISEGVYDAYRKRNLRYSQLAPVSMFDEVNTKTNLPAQIDLAAVRGREYQFLFMAKGGGSANKSYLFQKTKSVLNPKSMSAFVKEAVTGLGTAACPPYHLALVVGGTSAEANLKAVKLASAGYYDNLVTSGNDKGRAFRDLETEALVESWARETQIGAQFGGKYFVHDVRVLRLPRHGASCPIGIGVSCSADRQIKAKITANGIFMERLEHDPARFLPANLALGGQAVALNLRRPIAEILEQLGRLKVSTRVMLNGPMIVARDIAHAKILERINGGGDLPGYMKTYPVYYAGPAKTPAGRPSGSFGPTTSQRMDPYVRPFQQRGGSMIMVGKGNRTGEVTEACKEFGGFYLGSIGGPAARLGRDCITAVEVLDFAELGMEAVWKIEVKDFPAFIIVDNKGHDFFKGSGGEE